MDPLPVIGIVGLLFVKEAGVPVPIPGDLLVLGAGVAASGAGLGGPAELAAILLAGFAGGSLQFLLIWGAFRERLLRLLARLGVSRERLGSLATWLQRRGTRGVAVARATPGLRVGAIAASGIADLRFGVFLPGLIVGNTLFVGGHFALGYVIGPPALNLVAGSGGVLLLVGALVVLAALGGAAWMALRRRARGSRRPGRRSRAAHRSRRVRRLGRGRLSRLPRDRPGRVGRRDPRPTPGGLTGHRFVLSATTDEHRHKEDRRHDPRDGDQKRDRLYEARQEHAQPQARDGDCEQYQDDGARDHLLSLTPRVG